MHSKKNGAGRAHKLIVILLLLVILLLAAISCGLALRLYRRSDPVVAGRWRMEYELTDTARERANAWLRAARLGDRVDVGAYLPRLYTTVTLTLDEGGGWRRSVDVAALDDARTEAERALARAFCELLRLRAADAGRPAETTAQAQERIRGAIGMSAEAYLAAYGPALLPGPDELRALYEGSGSYLIDGPYLRFDGQDAVRYLADEAMLALEGEDRTEVYARA